MESTSSPSLLSRSSVLPHLVLLLTSMLCIHGALAQTAQKKRENSTTTRKAIPRAMPALDPRAQYYDRWGRSGMVQRDNDNQSRLDTRARTGGRWRSLIPAELLDTQLIFTAIYQIGLERLHFSTGWVDGAYGPLMRQAVSAYQQSVGLPRTGIIDQATSSAIGVIYEPFQTYTLTQEDFNLLMKPIPTIRAQAKAKRLKYTDPWEIIVERFHVSPIMLRRLNPYVADLEVGMTLIVPNPEGNMPIPAASSVRIRLDDKALQAYDTNGRIIAHFPCAIAADRQKAPVGKLKVTVVQKDPHYLFSPEILKEAAAKEGITEKLILPPGPNNPVGIAWIGLSRQGYGIHGTPYPSKIGQEVSHGCFRLANWNADKFRQMVKVGTPVEVVHR